MPRLFPLLCCVSALCLQVSVVVADVDAGPMPPARSAAQAGLLNLQAEPEVLSTAALPNVLDNVPEQFAATRYVLQLDGPMTPARRQALVAAGIVVGDYLPNFAYIADLRSVAPASITALPFVTWVGEYRADWKLAPGIGNRPYFTDTRVLLGDQGRVVVDITLFDGADENSAVDSIAAIPGLAIDNLMWYDDQTEITATLPLGAVAQLADVPEVQFVEEAPDVDFRNATTRWIAQSNTTNMTPVYDAGIHGENQIAGVMDGKADQNHCSLNSGKILFYNTSAGAATHGTHVSGTVVGDNGVDDNTRGIAYAGNMVFDDTPSFTDTAMYNNLEQHHNQGARVHTNSWGDDGTTAYNGLTRGIDRFSYDYEESLVMFAVTNTSSLRNPENAKNLIAVGASQDTPNQANHCSGGAGPTSDGRRKPEVYLPGCSTQSAAAGTSCSTTSLTGTSMASPAVAGTSMLVRQYFTDGYYPTGAASAPDAFAPSGALVKATVINSSVDMTGVAGYPSNSEGWGRVRLDQALFFPGGARALFVDDLRNAFGLSTGEMVEYNIEVVGNTQKLKATLVWTDPPAASGAGSAWINNLDLEVVAPDASTYLGNVFSGGVSATGGSADGINNVEQVHVSSPTLGSWIVRVHGTAVNQGLQGYALVISGELTPEMPPLTIGLPSGAPSLVAPGTTSEFDVQITPGTENVAAADVFYSVDGGAFTSTALTFVSGEMYTATLPALDCNQTIDFYISADGDGGTNRTDPFDAPTSTYSAIVGTNASVADDPFEADSGWTVGDVTDTATLGIWNRMDPEGTAAQPEDDHSDPGTDCWVTDGFAGASLGANDVDNGATTLFSPVFDLSGAEDATVSYWRWYSNDAGAVPNTDIFTVDIAADGSTWVNAETVGPTGEEASGEWFYHEFNVSGFVGLSSTVQLRFVADDAGDASLIEAAIDDFQINAYSCTPPGECEADVNGDLTVDITDLGILLSNFGTMGGATKADGDLSGDGNVDITDLGILLAAFGQPCL
jgi:hypothetical protein